MPMISFPQSLLKTTSFIYKSAVVKKMIGFFIFFLIYGQISKIN